ncbi:MAG: hypothetical protein JW774_05720 [Candidatus Aureabacteria bacterium]|nr:hypothetical protein [Candidatus Auribacterota bacterium]
MKFVSPIFLLLALSVSCPEIRAEGVSAGVKLSTLGAGLEVTKSFSKYFNGRVGLNYLTYDYNGVETDMEYDIELKLSSVNALVDWLPFEGIFHVTGGILFNNNELNAVGVLTSSKMYTEIGDGRYTYEEVEELAGNITFNKTALYWGLGWGNPVMKGSGLSVCLDLGVVMQGSPKVDLSSTKGTIVNTPVFQQELSKEEDELENELEDFKLYPVISVGINYQF